MGLGSDQLRIFGKPLDRYPVGLVGRPAKLLESGTGSKRCFEVSVRRGPDGLLVFFGVCPSGERLNGSTLSTTHFVEADIDQRLTPPANMSPVVSPVGDRESQVPQEQGMQLLHSHFPLLRGRHCKPRAS